MPKTYNTISNFVEKFGDKMEYNKETNTIELGTNVEVDGNLTVNGQGGGGGTEVALINVGFTVTGTNELTNKWFNTPITGFPKDIADRLRTAFQNKSEPSSTDIQYLSDCLTSKIIGLWTGSGNNWTVISLGTLKYVNNFTFNEAGSFYFRVTTPNTFSSAAFNTSSTLQITGIYYPS